MFKLSFKRPWAGARARRGRAEGGRGLGSFRSTLTTQLYSSRTRNKAVVKLGVRNEFLTITWALTMQMLNDDLA